MPIARPFLFLLTETWNSLQAIRKFRSDLPVLFLSGKQDELIPPVHVKTLFRECSSQVKELKEFEGVGHNDTCTCVSESS